MRYQARTYRAQSYVLRDSKDNKENANISNVVGLHPTKLARFRDESMCLPKLESKISDVSTSVTTLPTQPLAPLKKDNLAEQLKKCYSELVAKDYSEDILQHICSKSSTSLGFLEPHAITPTLRSKMVDWMIEVLSSYKMSEETFFKSVKLMDQYLKKSSRRQQLKDLHLIGVTSMFTAAKYQEIHSFKLQVIYDKIARKKFRKTEILEKESDIINSIGFRMEEVTVYDIVKHAADDIKLPLSDALSKYFWQILLYLSKMSLFSHELAEEDTKVLAGAIYFIGLKTLEQVDTSILPERKLGQISELVRASEEQVIETSRKVLQLAKNFSKLFPNLANLKKFNKFEYCSE